MTKFNFGPIARTSAAGEDDTINLASYPLHVMLNALVGSTSVEEFIAWLWHDLYKPAFYWNHRGRGKLSWYHVPGIDVLLHKAEKTPCTIRTRTFARGWSRTHHGFQPENMPQEIGCHG